MLSNWSHPMDENLYQRLHKWKFIANIEKVSKWKTWLIFENIKSKNLSFYPINAQSLMIAMMFSNIYLNPVDTLMLKFLWLNYIGHCNFRLSKTYSFLSV